MISNSNVSKTQYFQWFEVQMFKNTMLFNDFKLKCLKTQCFSMITKSNVSKTQCFQWVEVQMFKNTMLFNDVKHKCLKT